MVKKVKIVGRVLKITPSPGVYFMTIFPKEYLRDLGTVVDVRLFWLAEEERRIFR